MTLSPDAAAVSSPKTFRVKYTALTDLTEATLVIKPAGIVITNDPSTTTVEEVLSDTSSTYGYVRPEAVDASKGTLTVLATDTTTITPAPAGTLIQWTGLDLMKGDFVTAVIGPVNVMSTADDYTWLVFLANDEAAVASTAASTCRTHNRCQQWEKGRPVS